jgi:hypothetical protein
MLRRLAACGPDGSSVTRREGHRGRVPSKAWAAFRGARAPGSRRGSWVGEGVGLSGHSGQSGGDFLEGGFDVGGGGGAGGLGVAGVGACDPVAEVAFHPGEGGVA